MPNAFTSGSSSHSLLSPPTREPSAPQSHSDFTTSSNITNDVNQRCFNGQKNILFQQPQQPYSLVHMHCFAQLLAWSTPFMHLVRVGGYLFLDRIQVCKCMWMAKVIMKDSNLQSLYFYQKRNIFVYFRVKTLLFLKILSGLSQQNQVSLIYTESQ